MDHRSNRPSRPVSEPPGEPPQCRPDLPPDASPTPGVAPPADGTHSITVRLASDLFAPIQTTPLTGRARSRANLTGSGNGHVKRSREAKAERGAAEWLAKVESIMEGPGLKRLLAEKLADPKTPPAYVGPIASALARITEAESQPVLRPVPASVEAWLEEQVHRERAEWARRGMCLDCQAPFAGPPGCAMLHNRSDA